MENKLLFAVIETKLSDRPNDPGIITWTGYPLLEADIELRKLTADPLTRVVSTTTDEELVKKIWAISVNPEATATAKRTELIENGLSEEEAEDQAQTTFEYLRAVREEVAFNLLRSFLSK